MSSSGSGSSSLLPPPAEALELSEYVELLASHVEWLEKRNADLQRTNQQLSEEVKHGKEQVDWLAMYGKWQEDCNRQFGAELEQSRRQVQQLRAELEQARRQQQQQQADRAWECPVCMGERVDTALPCGHLLCSACVVKLREARPKTCRKCPICRRTFGTKAPVRLFMPGGGG